MFAETVFATTRIREPERRYRAFGFLPAEGADLRRGDLEVRRGRHTRHHPQPRDAVLRNPGLPEISVLIAGIAHHTKFVLHGDRRPQADP